MNTQYPERILFIAGTLGQGGAEKQLWYLLRMLREAGADPHLLCLTSGEFWEEPIRSLGVPVIGVGGPPNRGGRLGRLGRIIAAIRRIRPTVIQSQHFYTNFYAGLAGRIMGIPSFGALRNDVVSEIRDSGPIGGRLCLSLPTMLIANSKAAIDTAIRLGVAPGRLGLLRNSIDVTPFAALPVPAMATPIRIVTAGRLVTQKRMDRFLRVFARVASSSPVTCEGAIIGTGPEQANLRCEAANLRLDGPTGNAILRLSGSVDDPLTIQRESDIFVLLSDWEGMPNVILEAMAAGRPVVTTAVGDLPAVIDHGRNGFCFPRDQQLEESAAEAILGLIANPARARDIGQQARRTIAEEFSLAGYHTRVAKIYRRHESEWTTEEAH